MDIDVDIHPTAASTIHLLLGGVRASQVDERRGILTPHVGVYLQNVPIDPQTGLAAAPYKLAEELGCFKIDFLPLHVLAKFESRDDILALLDEEPDWTLLVIPSVVEKLFHLSKHYQLLQEVKPRTVLELADALALIRPQKAYMLPYYMRDKEGARQLLYTREEGDAYAFKKAHAIAYALIIVLQLHLAKAGLL